MAPVRTVPLLALALLAACGGGGGGPPDPLAGFATDRILVDATEFEVWLAEEPWQRAQGLMGVPAEALAPLPDDTPRGMLFVWPAETYVSFWMRDTEVALDLAYARADGTIFEVHAMVPFDETPVPSSEPVAFALEVPAGTLSSLGLGVGSVIVP